MRCNVKKATISGWISYGIPHLFNQNTSSKNRTISSLDHRKVVPRIQYKLHNVLTNVVGQPVLKVWLCRILLVDSSSRGAQLQGASIHENVSYGRSFLIETWSHIAYYFYRWHFPGTNSSRLLRKETPFNFAPRSMRTKDPQFKTLFDNPPPLWSALAICDSFYMHLNAFSCNFGLLTVQIREWIASFSKRFTQAFFAMFKIFSFRQPKLQHILSLVLILSIRCCLNQLMCKRQLYWSIKVRRILHTENYIYFFFNGMLSRLDKI